MEIRELHIRVRGLGSGVRGLGSGVRGPGFGVRGLGFGVRGLGAGPGGVGAGVQAFVEALLGRFTRRSRFRRGVEYIFWTPRGRLTSCFLNQDRRVIGGPRIELTLICCSGAEPVTMNRTSEAANVSRSSRRETAGMRWELVDRRVSGRETGVLQSQMNATIRESHERNLRLVNRIVRQYARRLELLTKDEMSASENGTCAESIHGITPHGASSCRAGIWKSSGFFGRTGRAWISKINQSGSA